MAVIPLEVTEWMKGYIGFGATDYDAGFIRGIEAGTFFMHEMLIRIDDIDRFVGDPGHAATMDGFIQCDALGGKRPVKGAAFNMFVDAKNPRLKYMLYRIPFHDGSGAPHTMFGHKTVHDDRTLDLYGDTTTLYVRIFRGDVPGHDLSTPAITSSALPDDPIAKGVIHIEKLDLYRSIRSFRSPGSNPAAAAHAFGAFGQFFMGKLWEVYGMALR